VGVANGGVQLQIEVAGDAVAKINSIADSVKRMESSGNKSIFSFARAWETATGVIAGSAVIKTLENVANAAVNVAKVFTTESVRAAEEAQVAQNKLNQALALAGEYSKEASDKFSAFASEIQRTTTVEDDAVRSAAALLQSLAQLSEQGLEDATRTAIDMSAALGIDLDTAVRMVGKAANGEVGSFKKLGISIEEGDTKAETLANTLSVLNAKFGGSAAAQVNTYAGATAQLKNNFGDFQEEIGNVLVKNNAFVEVTKAASSVVAEWAGAMASGNGTAKTLAGEGLVALIDVAAGVVFAFDSIATVGKVAFLGVKGALDTVALGMITLVDGPLAILYKALSLLPGIGDRFQERFDAILTNAAAVANEVNASASKINDALNNPSDTAKQFESVLLRLREAASTGLAAVKSGADATVEPLNAAKVATDELTEAQIKLGEEGQKVAQRLAGEDPTVKYLADVAALEEANNQKLDLAIEYDAAIAALDAGVEAKAAESRAKEIADLAQRNEYLKTINATANEAEISSNKQKIDFIVAQERGLSTQALKIKSDQVAREKQQEELRAQNFRSTLGTISTLMQSGSIELFRIGQAAAIASATIDGVAAVQKALASAPPPFNIALAALVGTATAINIGKIASQQPPKFADGGIVPGFSTSGDKVPVLANSGEMFLNRPQQQRLLDIANGGGAAREGGSTDRLLGEIINRLDRLSTVVYVDGREVFNSMRSQLQSGRAFT
jgi:hypothetical protein